MCVCMCILHSSGRKRRTRMKKGDTLLFLLRDKQIFFWIKTTPKIFPCTDSTRSSFFQRIFKKQLLFVCLGGLMA